MDHPLVSVIIPVRNGEKHLGRALESVFAQGYEPLEVIVVDDGSTDGTRTVAKSFSAVTLLSQSNRGPAAARNTGIAAAQGDPLAFLDADDRWLPGKLDAQIGYHLAHPEVGYTLTHQKLIVDDEGGPVPWLRQRLMKQDHPGFFPSSLVARRDVFEIVGTFDPAFTHGEGADWFARAKDAGVRRWILAETLLHKHVHADNLSHSLSSGRAQVLRAIRASIERQRDSGE